MNAHSSNRTMSISAAGAILAALFSLFFSWEAFAGDNQNFPGRDYSNFDAASAFVCFNTCGGESTCRAYSFVKPGVQGPSGRCWLKNAIPEAIGDACCFSGRHPQNVGSMMKAEGSTDRPGSDYRSFEVNAWESCQSTCQGENQCSSWTYVKPGVQGPSGRCWLKNVVARPIPSSATVSGVKFKPASVNFD